MRRSSARASVTHVPQRVSSAAGGRPGGTLAPSFASLRCTARVDVPDLAEDARRAAVRLPEDREQKVLGPDLLRAQPGRESVRASLQRVEGRRLRPPGARAGRVSWLPSIAARSASYSTPHSRSARAATEVSPGATSASSRCSAPTYVWPSFSASSWARDV